jgi:hypothetical protein
MDILGHGTHQVKRASTYEHTPHMRAEVRMARARVSVFDVIPAPAPWRWDVIETGSGRLLARHRERAQERVVAACRTLYPWAEYAGDIRAEEEGR